MSFSNSTFELTNKSIVNFFPLLVDSFFFMKMYAKNSFNIVLEYFVEKTEIYAEVFVIFRAFYIKKDIFLKVNHKYSVKKKCIIKLNCFEFWFQFVFNVILLIIILNFIVHKNHRVLFLWVFLKFSHLLWAGALIMFK